MQTGDDDARSDTNELFPEICSPAILDDESIYSWCARLHRLNGRYNPRATSRLLFDHPSAGLRHDLPTHMAHFQRKTRGNIGTLSEILRTRTLYGFHAPFLPAVDEEEVRLFLVSGQNASAGSKLGLARAGLKTINPLKFCPVCVREQVATHGVAWWRTTHQLPSSFICEIHDTWLKVLVATQRRGAMCDFYLPDAYGIQGGVVCHPALVDNRSSLTKLGEWGHFVRAQEHLRLTETSLRHSYLLQAKVRGWLALDGSVRIQHLRDAFLAHYQGALVLFDQAFLGDLRSVNAGFLAHLFRQLPSRRHPLKHLLLMNFLFESPEEFIVTYAKIRSMQAEGGDEAVRTLLQEKASLLIRLVEEGQSVNRAATIIGVPVTQAVRTLDKKGIHRPDRRPRVVGTAKEKQLQEMLRKGIGRKEIAQTVGVRPAFIKDYLATRTELKTVWEQAYHFNQRVLHRQQFKTALQQSPDLPIKSIRRLPGNGFQWLYNNDREWLQEVLPAIWKR